MSAPVFHKMMTAFAGPSDDSPTTPSSQPLQAPSSPQPLQSFAAAIPTAIDQVSDTLNPAHATGASTAKEAAQLSFTIERPTIDVPGVQLPEQLTAPEQETMPPEV